MTGAHEPAYVDGLARAANAARWAFLAHASVAIANLPVTFMLARALAPEGLGSFQLLNRIALVAIGIALIGYPHALAWAAARASDASELRGLFRNALRVSAVQGTVVVGAALAVLLGGWQPDDTVTWLLISAYALANVLTVNVAALYRGTLALASYALIRFSQALCWLILASVLFVTDSLTVTSAVVTLLVSQSVSFLVAIGWTLRRGLLGREGAPADQSAILRFSLRLFPGLTIREWNIYLVQIVVGFAFSRHDLGLFAVAASVTIALGMLATAFAHTAQPVVQRTARPLQLAATARLVGSAGGFVAVGALLLFATAPVLIPWAYGSEYRGAVVLVQVLCAAAVIDAVNVTLHGVLLALDRPGDSSRAAVLGFAVSVVGWLILLPTLGLVGAALTSVGAYAVVAVAMARSAAKGLGCSNGDLVRAVMTHAMSRVLSISRLSSRAYERFLARGAR